MQHTVQFFFKSLGSRALSFRARQLAVVCACVLLSGCATTMEPTQTSMSRLSMEYLDSMDLVITEAGPVNVDGVELSTNEKDALNTPSTVRWQLNDYARDAIKHEFVFLHYKRGGSIKTWLSRSSRYIGYAKNVFRKQGLPEDLAYLPFIESGFNPTARSHAGAVGLWQFMPATGRNHGLAYNRYLDERRNPWKATYAAAAYLKKLHDMFDDWSLALAAYNAGEGKIGRACKATGAKNFFELAMKNETLTGKTKLKPETMHYVPRFIAMLKIANNAVALGYPALDERLRGEPHRHPIPANLDLKALAKNVGLDWKDFKEHNPHFRLSISPPNSGTHVYLPSKPGKQLAAYLKSPVMATKASRARALAEVRSQGGGNGAGKDVVGDTKMWYKVQKGDTLAKIARTYRIPLRVILNHNKKKPSQIKPGDLVAIPSYASANQDVEAPSAKKIADAATKARRSKEQLAKALKQPPESKAIAATHTVKAGDTCYSLARKFGCSVDDLLKLNGMASASALRVGMQLRVPGGAGGSAMAQKASSQKTIAKAAASTSKKAPATVYKVEQGDTIWSIARKFQVSPFAILEWNNMNTESSLQPGDQIQVYLAAK